ncbi:MAG: hydrogenase 4 subunit B [Elusimicrobia bacterium RIFCSPLOWO2_02_FULL_39_32]|nr:MAG: hydrogenase 4 subunit B [Elusimicrobia bacterium RIFCSPHIGHO2_02_FULL_39_36]OGR91091.1 MAG: hydrogenase 4 subunit B [Elusimicrobia bacterium RIFCSPLOWO2_02_FULL_39_32]OGS00058.1 MAG: hydrogenase 4 subunit B [Elusimicrobia bacterium RIFCSPLOWO2_12_FULL_39_28]
MRTNPLTICIFLFIAGALSSLIFKKRPSLARISSLSFAALSSGILFFNSILFLKNENSMEIVLPSLGLLSGFHFYFTPLSSPFIAIISGLSLLASIYAITYAKEYDENAAGLGFFFNLFILGMSLVPIAQNVFTFLFCWEGMTLASFFLVILEHKIKESRKAAYIYLVMSHLGAAFIFLIFFLLYQTTGSWEFQHFRIAAFQLPNHLKNILFILVLLGFGTKAGLVPLHLWLPYAHPAAPSHVSSLMSGVMIKTAIYGFLLILFSFLKGGPWWWGAIILMIASISSLVGILHALMENNLKRLLAYSSVENIGIILMGVGASLLFHSFSQDHLAALALTAGLYHTLNHALFKGLLFLSSGSVIKAAHTKNMEEMGGIIKKMPITAFCFLIGSMAVSALPPLNGFVSEWLTFQVLLSGFNLNFTSARIVCLIATAALALTGALAVACFVKAFGITFLAQPRSEKIKQCRDPSILEIAPMVCLSLGCLIFGIFPNHLRWYLKPTIEFLLPNENPLLSSNINLFNSLSGNYGSIFPMGILASLMIGILLAMFLSSILNKSNKVRKAPTWGCGLDHLDPRMEYTSTAFSKPFRILFAFFYRPMREVRQETTLSPYFLNSIHYSNEITHIIKETLYHPPLKVMLKVSRTLRRIQSGSLNLYLGYLLATVIFLITLFLWRET